jgi:DNA-binding GntR family transcriptional regulator
MIQTRVTAPTDTRISPQSIVHLVVDDVRRLALSGEFKPGERLIEERLAERYGISRPPLREALRILQQEGLLQHIPRRGVFVTSLTPTDVRELYSLRWALERFALELALPIDDSARLTPLREAIQMMREAGRAADDHQLLEANQMFHVRLVALPRHSHLSRTHLGLLRQIQLYMALNLRARHQVTHDPEDSVRRHVRLLTAIEQGSLSEVQAEITAHGDRTFLEQSDETDITR